LAVQWKTYSDDEFLEKIKVRVQGYHKALQDRLSSNRDSMKLSNPFAIDGFFPINVSQFASEQRMSLTLATQLLFVRVPFL